MNNFLIAVVITVLVILALNYLSKISEKKRFERSQNERNRKKDQALESEAIELGLQAGRLSTERERNTKIEQRQKIDFRDSNWVVLYTALGIFSTIILLVCLLTGQWGLVFATVCFAGSCFFAAHLLRVQERTAHYSEQQAKLLEKILDERQ